MNVDAGLHEPRHSTLAPHRLVPRRYAYGIAVLAAIVAAAAATTWQMWPEAQSSSATTPPAWFQQIAAYYHDDPAITPQFDFASLYAGGVTSAIDDTQPEGPSDPPGTVGVSPSAANLPAR
jgi:hypothetical protein